MNDDLLSGSRLLAAAVPIALLWSIFGAYVLNASLPYNAIHLPMEEDLDLQVLLPQGWNFFTKDARSPRMQYYRTNGGSWTSINLGPNSRPTNAFGLNRQARGQGVEAGLLLQSIPDSSWMDCAAPAPECLSEAALADTVRNPSPSPSLCGTVGVVRRPPVPWAWSRSGRSIHMPGNAIKIHSQCETD